MEFLIEPWAHQRELLRRAVSLDWFGIFAEPGTGKTGVAINILRHHCNKKSRFLRTLIFGPPIVCGNWKAEIKLHSKIDPDRVLVLGSGHAKKRLELFQKKKAQFPDGFISILNYEALLMPDLYRALEEWSSEFIVFDESHRLKNHEAKRSQLAERLANPWDKKTKVPLPKPLTYILTGSPVLNSPEDFFQQMLIMDGGRTFGENYHAFKRTYFTNRNANAPRHVTWPKWEIKTLTRDGMDGLEAIRQKIAPTTMFVKKTDCLDLPPLVRQTVGVELSAQQRKHYEEMRDDFITYTKDAACVATLAITKALRLSQIVSGYLPVNFKETPSEAPFSGDNESVAFDENPRLQALREILKDLVPTAKVLVWAVWRENYKQIKEVLSELKIQFVEVHGDVTPKQKALNVKKFNTDPNVRVFLGNPGAGGIGINLVSASYSVFYSRTTSLEHSIQAEARNYRGGSEIHEKITRIDLVAPGTIDELIMTSLANKEAVTLKLLQDNLEKI